MPCSPPCIMLHLFPWPSQHPVLPCLTKLTRHVHVLTPMMPTIAEGKAPLLPFTVYLIWPERGWAFCWTIPCHVPSITFILMRTWAKGMYFQQAALELPQPPCAWPALAIDRTQTNAFSYKKSFSHPSVWCLNWSCSVPMSAEGIRKMAEFVGATGRRKVGAEIGAEGNIQNCHPSNLMFSKFSGVAW